MAERLERHEEEEPDVSMAVFSTLEDLRGEGAVHEAVVAAIKGVHDIGAGGDGATVAEIIGETAEQRRGGRVRYVIVAEAVPRDAGAARADYGGGGGERTGARRADSRRDGGGEDGGGAGVPMLPAVGGARDRASNRARGEMMPRITLTRVSGGRVKRAVIKKGSGGKAVAHAEGRHAAGGAQGAGGERLTGGGGDVATGGGDGGGGGRDGGRGAKSGNFHAGGGAGQEEDEAQRTLARRRQMGCGCG